MGLCEKKRKWAEGDKGCVMRMERVGGGLCEGEITGF
jgi:hypothetical protein